MLHVKENGKVNTLMLTVYSARKWDREGADPSNGGPSGYADEIFVACEEGPFERDPDDPLLYELVENYGSCRLVPANHRGEDKVIGPMMSGNYAGTSDSRFSKMVERLTGCDMGIAPVHDRYETPRQNYMLSI